MSNLLDKASIILTPTAYNNGEALCIKPSDGSGDFDFSRNSAATRVNAQGLVENVQILSSNLVQNGSFSEEGVQEISNGSFSQEGVELVTNGDFATDSDWFKGTGWTISGGTANAAIPVASGLTAIVGALTIGTTYKLTYTISNYSEGNIVIQAGWQASGTSRSANGTYTEYLVCAGDTKVAFLGTSSFTGSIDNVSVREVAQDWGFGTGWSIAEDKAVCDGSVVGNSFLISTGNTLTIGKTYKVQYTILDYIQGNIRVRAGDATSIFVNADGSYTEYMVATNTETCRIQARNNFIGSITNISVKEVGQNWEFGDGWSVGSGLASKSSGTASNLFQSNVLVVGLAYKVTFTLSNYSNGNVTPYCGGTGAGTSRASNGTFTEIIIALTSTTFFLVANSTFTGSVTNISVIEITDDTNLPRINYEGFSYQDALGSELVTNGDFATDSDWSVPNGADISNGLLNFDGSQSGAVNVNQSIPSVDLTKTYKVTFTISNYVSGLVKVKMSNNAQGDNRNSNGTYTEYLSGMVNNALSISGNLNFQGSIDNVSVKEYLGQEVVPDSGCGSWLFEPQSTNLFNNSEDFSSGSWVKTDCSVVSNFGVSPSGQNNASKLTFTTTNTSARAQYNLGSLTTGTTYTQSYYIKSLGADITLRIGTSASSVGEFTDIIATSEWQRFEFTGIASGTTEFPRVQNITGTLGVEILVWGAQFEALSYPTSLIPTSGSTVTRNQDLCTNGGSLASINSTEGVLYAEIAAFDDDSLGRYITISDGVLNSNAIRLLYHNSNAVYFQKIVNGVRTTNLATTSITKTDFNKIAIRYNSTDVSAFVNGVNISNNADTNIISPNTLNVLEFENVTESFFFGKTKCVAVWKEALTDEELTELTTI